MDVQCLARANEWTRMGYCGPGCMGNRTAIFKVTIGRSPLKHGRERSRHSFTHLLIGGNRVNGRGRDALVS
jgi:hypothetical protein